MRNTVVKATGQMRRLSPSQAEAHRVHVPMERQLLLALESEAGLTNREPLTGLILDAGPILGI